MAQKDEFLLKNKMLKGFIRKGAKAGNKGWISTGHFDLDFSIKYGKLPGNADFEDLDPPYDPTKQLGLPLGRIVELFGPEAGGKSSLAYRICGYAQKMGGIAAWIDTEHSFEESLATLNGCDVDELLYSELYDPDDPEKSFFAEDIMDNMIELCKAGVKVIVLDSIANLVSKVLDERNAEQQNMALIARLLSGQLGKVAHYANKNNVLVVCINQIREKIGVMYGNPEVTPGGKALKFNSSVRIKIAKINKAEEVIWRDTENDKEIIGRYSSVTLIKNRMGPPALDGKGKDIHIKIPIYYKPYFPNLAERLFDTARQLKIITPRLDVFTWKSKEMKIDGRGAFIAKVQDDKLESDLLKEIQEVAKENLVTLPPEIILAALEMEKKKKKTDAKPKQERISKSSKTSHSKVGQGNAA